MATNFWVNIGSGYGLLPDDNKRFPERRLIISDVQRSSFEGDVTRNTLKPSINKSTCKSLIKILFKSVRSQRVNSLRPRQNGRHVADDIFKRIFLNKNVRILIWISLKFVPMGPINNIPALVQIMAWRRPGDKPLSEPIMVRLPTHICVTRPQWVKAPLRCNIWPSQPPAAGLPYVEAPATTCHRVTHCLTYVHLDGTWTCAGGLQIYYMVCMIIYAWNLMTFPWPVNDLFTIKSLI